MNDYDVIVVGGGCAGMMAAGTAASMGRRTLLLERNHLLGKKMLITGKGRCNITNNCDRDTFLSNIPVNPRFLYSAYARFTCQDAMQWLEDLGVPLKTERGNRVFPQSDKAADIVSAFQRYVRQSGAQLMEGRVSHVLYDDGVVTGVQMEDGRILTSMSVVVATGGKSYQATGSTGDGYRFAQEAGHTIVPVHPSLVPLNTRQQFCRDMQGLSLRNVSLRVMDDRGKEVYQDFGEMLFTHFGVSGPLILSASAHMRDFDKRQYYLLLDLKPALDEETLDRRLLRDFEEMHRKDFGNSLALLLPKKMIPVIVRLSGIPADKKVSGITREERKRLVQLLKGLRIDILSPRDINEAIVTTGGVSVKEVDPRTMESKKVAGLFFAGEVLDVDGYTGGFNLQIAMCTGYLAGLHV